jgi:hypothetical protein
MNWTTNNGSIVHAPYHHKQWGLIQLKTKDIPSKDSSEKRRNYPSTHTSRSQGPPCKLWFQNPWRRHKRRMRRLPCCQSATTANRRRAPLSSLALAPRCHSCRSVISSETLPTGTDQINGWESRARSNGGDSRQRRQSFLPPWLITVTGLRVLITTLACKTLCYISSHPREARAIEIYMN